MSSISRRVLLFVGVASVLATFVVGCGRGTVAKVNGRNITRQEYYNRLERLPYADQASGQNTEAGAMTLQRLITEELLLRLSEKEHVAPTDQQIKERIAQSMKQPNFSSNLRKAGITKEQLKELMRVEQAAFNLQTKGVTVSPQDVKSFYDQGVKTQFTVPEQVSLAGIFVNSKAEADKCMSMLKSGADFGTVARMMSKDPSSAKVDGKLNPLARGNPNIPEPVQKIIFSTPKGEHTNPISSGKGGFVIFQVLQHTPSKVQRLAEVQNLIRDRMMLEKGMQKNQNLNEELAKFRESAKIDVNIERYKPLMEIQKPAGQTPGKTGKK